MNGTWNQQAVDQWYQENLARGVSTSKLNAIVQQQQADYLVGQGLPAKELQTTPIGLRAQAQEVGIRGYEPPEEKDKEKIKTSAGPILKEMLSEYEKVPSSQKGPAIGQISKRIGWLTPEAAEYTQGIKGFAGALKSLVGETGVLTDWDIQRIIGIFPQITDIPKQAEIAKKRLNNIWYTKFGEKLYEETDFDPEWQYSNLYPAPTGKGKEKKGEVTAPSKEEELLQQTAGAFPVVGGLLGQMLGGPLGAGAGTYAGTRAQQVAQTRGVEAFQRNPLLAALGPIGMLPEGFFEIEPSQKEALKAGAIVGITSLALQKILGLRGMKGKLGRGREVAAQTAQETTGGASTLNMVKNAEAFLEAHPDAATPQNLKILEGLKNTPRISIPDLLGRTQVWNDAYTASGGVAKGLHNKVYDILAKTGKEELKLIAPEVAKYTAKLRFLYQVPKEISKKTWQISKTAGGIAALKYILGVGR